jgi:uncharacterized protein YuzE
MDQFVKHGLIFDYDDEADVLYITDPTLNVEPIGEMNDEGIIVRRNPDNGKICGITILDFMKRTKENKNGILTNLSATFQVA